MHAENVIFGIVLNVLEKIVVSSVIKCDEIIKTTKSILTKSIPITFNEEEMGCKMQNFYILLVFS